MMKKSHAIRLCFLILALLTLCVCTVSGTLARFASTSKGNASVRVAKWDVVMGDNATQASTFTFDLFKTITDSDGASAETHISKTDGSLIAPGTCGSFAVVLTNKSDVTAAYAVDFTVTNTGNIPLQFSLDNTNWKTDINALDISAVEGDGADSTELAFSGGSKTVTVYWKWAFDGDAATDTNLGRTGTATVKVEARVTIEQVG